MPGSVHPLSFWGLVIRRVVLGDKRLHKLDCFPFNSRALFPSKLSSRYKKKKENSESQCHAS